MSTSGNMSTSNQYVKYTISINQNSQNVSNNYSNVTVTVRFFRTNSGYTTYGSGTCYCKINGTTYSSTVSSSQKITDSGINLFSKTLDIYHNNDGTKTLTCSAIYQIAIYYLYYLSYIIIICQNIQNTFKSSAKILPFVYCIYIIKML